MTEPGETNEWVIATKFIQEEQNHDLTDMDRDEIKDYIADLPRLKEAECSECGKNGKVNAEMLKVAEQQDCTELQCWECGGSDGTE